MRSSARTSCAVSSAWSGPAGGAAGAGVWASVTHGREEGDAHESSTEDEGRMARGLYPVGRPPAWRDNRLAAQGAACMTATPPVLIATVPFWRFVVASLTAAAWLPAQQGGASRRPNSSAATISRPSCSPSPSSSAR